MSHYISKKLNVLLNYNNQKADKIGIVSSGLCMVHCLITPLLFAVQATSMSCSEISPGWWKMVDILFLIISFVAIIYTAKNTSSSIMPRLLYWSWTVLAIIVFNSLFSLIHLPHALIYIPALALVALHMYNRKYCRCKDDSSCTTS